MSPVKLVLGFVPFLLFTVLTAWIPVGWAAVVGVVAALALVVVTAKGGLKTLPLVQAVILLILAQLDHSGRTSHQVYTAGFYGDDRDFSVRLLLGKATRGGTDIGECWPELYMTRSTVAFHLSNAYAKTGTASRHELVQLLRSHRR